MATRKKTHPRNYSGRGRYATADTFDPAPRTALAALVLPENSTIEVVTRHGVKDHGEDGRPLGVYTETAEPMHVLPQGSIGGFIN